MVNQHFARRVPPDSLSHSYERVPIHALSQIISRAVSSELGPLFGLKFAENIHATTYHCYGLMLISSPTLRQFCLRLARYYPRVTTNKSVSFDVAGDTARLIYHCHGDVHDSPAARLRVFRVGRQPQVRMLRMVSSPGFAPKAVKFSTPAPLGFVEDYRHYFAVLSSLVAMLTPCALTPRPSTRPWRSNAELARRSERQVFDHLNQMGSVDLETQIRMAFSISFPRVTMGRPTSLIGWD